MSLEQFLVKTFPCKVCKGIVVPTAKEGRFYDYSGILILVPPTFIIPRCTTCNQEWFTADLHAALDKVLRVEFDRHKEMIAAVVRAYEARQAQL